MSDKLKPNFLIIGAAQSGTTTLYRLLQEHPEIYLPAQKRPEPHFFLKKAEYQQGTAYYENKYFAAATTQIARGEASTSYLLWEHVAQAIQAYNPNMKLIVMLRQPVMRAFSNYWHTVKSGINLENLDFDTAVRTETARSAAITDPRWQEIQPFAYVARGMYFKQLSTYLKYFPRQQMFPILLDDLISDPNQVLVDTFNFLGVTPSVSSISQPDRIENSVKPADVEMLPETRDYLMTLFRPDILALAALLERDLSCWLE